MGSGGLSGALVAALLVALLVALMVFAPGCRVIRYFFPSDQIELAGGGSAGPLPINSASTRGLEVRLWIVDDTNYDAPRALAVYLDDQPAQGVSPLDPAAITSWSDWGFRIIPVPIDEVQGFLDAMRSVQPANVQWLGEFGRWRAIVRAGALDTDRVRVGQRSVQIEQGRPRLIARAWVLPMLTESDVVPALRLDLGMQIESPKPTRDPGFAKIDRERMIEDQGALLDELMLSVMLDGSQAMVIVGEAPETLWDELPDPIQSQSPNDRTELRAKSVGPAEPGTETPAEDAKPSGDRAQGRQAPRPGAGFDGPRAPIEKTLGELMLTSPGTRMPRANQSRVVPKRVIVVLIPRVEGGYRLLSRGEPRLGREATP